MRQFSTDSEIEYVVYSITTRCNLNCPGCFRVGTGQVDVELKVFKESLSILKGLGCRYLNISGGELQTDFHEDGFIDFADYAELAAEWLWTGGWYE